MNTKSKVYVAISMGFRSIKEIANKCCITEEITSKICWQGVRLKEVKYEKYPGIEIFGDTLHFYLTKLGRQEMRISCMEQRINQLEIILRDNDITGRISH